jgi:hypothetical protein
MWRITVLVAGLVLVLAGAADAARAPKPGEQKAIRSIVTGFVNQPNSPAAKDDRIASLRISTVDARFAAVKLFSKTAGAGELILHRGSFGWFVQGFGSDPACASAPPAVMRDLGVGCSPPNGTAWVNDCGPLASAPRTLVLACADGNYELASLTWRGWGSAHATATGVARANDCTPNCAAGHFHSYPVTATVDRLTRCGAARYYARLTIVYGGTRPQGIGRSDVHTLGC